MVWSATVLTANAFFPVNITHDGSTVTWLLTKLALTHGGRLGEMQILQMMVFLSIFSCIKISMFWFKCNQNVVQTVCNLINLQNHQVYKANGQQVWMIWFLFRQADWCCNQNALDKVQYIPRNMHTVFALLCFVVVIHWLIFPYPSGLLHCHCGNLTIAPVPAKQPWWIWINTSCEFIMNDCITTTKQSTTKPCAYFLGYTVCHQQHYVDGEAQDCSNSSALDTELLQSCVKPSNYLCISNR